MCVRVCLCAALLEENLKREARGQVLRGWIPPVLLRFFLQQELRITARKLTSEMNLPCQVFTSFLLIFDFSTEGADTEEKWGALNRDIYLDIIGFLGKQEIDDIRWKIDNIQIARFTKNKGTSLPPYEVFANGTLKIKHLMSNDSNTYKVSVYDSGGKSTFEKAFKLKVLEGVSKPVISWNCINKSLTCEVEEGTDPVLTLYLNKKGTPTKGRKITKIFTSKLNPLVRCEARNDVSKEAGEENVSCAENVLNIYIILAICGGGTILIVFLALLIYFISKRGKQTRRTNDEELEARAPRGTAKERAWAAQHAAGSASQKPAASQPPAPPGQRPQAAGQRPPPPGPRAQHQQQRRPPPPGPQGPQQRGPPLPRPRAQPKPPRGADDNA
ncbi:T-cell surface antigen CD2 isoform X2 [Dasypus novemcinctus]|uniref:T-cell surface antigen CD2 isoform X2 n=1 Tax=Dasypus novemcinctus TaxID=9361 RepID=UPI00265F288A|nr:T-cell surface antigen CD2 isoform X2 [Dasypus novemcinctus]